MRETVKNVCVKHFQLPLSKGCLCYFWLAISVGELAIIVGDCWPTLIAFDTYSIALTKYYERALLDFESTGVIKCENRGWTDEIRLVISTCLGGKNARD